MAMEKGAKIPNSVKVQSGFKSPMDGFKSLGIHILASLKKLYEVNYQKILKYFKY